MKKMFYLILIYPLLCTTITAHVAQEYLLSDFDTSMYNADKYKKAYQQILKNPREASFILWARQKYNVLVRQWPWQEIPKIPKIIHQIWVGPHDMPKDFKKWQRTWLLMHPDWEYKLWTDTEVAQLKLINQEYYDTTQSYGEKANILRYEILYRFGGVYIDTDFECIKPLDFLHHTCDFYAGFEFPQLDKNFLVIGNAILGACPGHMLINLFIHQMQYYWHHSWQPKRSGTFFVTDIIKRTIDQIDDFTVIFPANFFYPWSDDKKPWEQRSLHYRDTLPPESIGFHHWDLSWQKKK